MNDRMMHLENDLERLLATYKKNVENVPISVLKTKYKGGFEKLVKQILSVAGEYAKLIAIGGVRYIEKDADYLIHLLSDAYYHSKWIKEIQAALFDKQDVKAVKEYAVKMRIDILMLLYPYYQDTFLCSGLE